MVLVPTGTFPPLAGSLALPIRYSGSPPGGAPLCRVMVVVASTMPLAGS